MQLLTILALAIALLAVLFALQNPTPVLINLFVWQFQGPLAVVILLTLVVGVAAGVLVSMPTIIRHSWKLGTYKKRLEDLGWQLQQKEQELTAVQQQTETVRQKNQEMLTVMGATEAKTGLLKGETALQGISHLLQQQDLQPTQTGDVCVYLIDAQTEAPVDSSVEEKVWQAIAQRLQQIAPPGSWMHHNGRGQFTCAVAGLNTRSAADFGETVKSAVINPPVSLADGSLAGGTGVLVMVSVGGAIAHPNEHIDSHRLLQQAEAALEHAHKRGRNRVRLVEAKA